MPINIPLAKDYSVDYGNLRSYVDFLCENQAPVIFFTHGSSEFKSMSEHEIEKLCRTAAEQARGRALVIGGTGKWWTGKSIDFIRRLEDSGVDGVNLHLFTKKPEEVYAAFSEVSSRTRLPLLGYDEDYSPDLVARLSTIPRVCGLKSHDALYRYHDFIRAVKDKKICGHWRGTDAQFPLWIPDRLSRVPLRLCSLCPGNRLPFLSGSGTQRSG